MSAPKTLTNFTGAAQDHTFASVETTTWSSDDGEPVEGILMHPHGSHKSGPSPLILFTHCGPAMAVLQTFVGYGSVCARFPLEIWAERGYTVLMPNYRGSTGYGKRFRRADRHDWGGQDYNDVFSGASHLIKTGQVNPDKIAVSASSIRICLCVC